MKKRIVTLTLYLSLLLSIMTPVYAADIKDELSEVIHKRVTKSMEKEVLHNFKDVKETDWYITTVAKMVAMNSIDGYPDKTFRPKNTMNRGEFVKTILTAMGYSAENSTTGHWAENYAKKALEVGMLEESDMKNYTEKNLNVSIPRQEMAKIAVLASKEENPHNMYEFSSQMKDFEKIGSDYRRYVLKAYSLGIIGGYPDNTFKPSGALSRAEACEVILRVVAPESRLNPQIKQIVYNDTEYPLLNEFLSLYPNNATAVLPRAVNFNPKLKPKTKDDEYTLAFGSIDYMEGPEYNILFLAKDEKTLNALKDSLKLVYPNEYEKVFKEALLKWDDKPLVTNHQAYYDGRYTIINRLNDAVIITIGKQGAKW